MTGEKILIVEDDALLSKMYRTVLQNAGYKPMVASDGEQGLATAKEEVPALIMMDIMMPKMNGLQVLDELRKDAVTAKVPVIVLTGLSKVNEEKDVLARGASRYLDKSEYDPHKVVKIIQEELAKVVRQATAPATVTGQQQVSTTASTSVAAGASGENEKQKAG